MAFGKKLGRSMFFAVLLGISSAALGDDDGVITDPVTLSLAAGYKATFTCSSVFNAGRTPTQIAGDEFNRIYPDFRAAFAQVSDAVIDKDAGLVRVAYLDDFPPRLARWTGPWGCVQLPAGTPLDSDMVSGDRIGLAGVPVTGTSAKVARSSARRMARRAVWPVGDRTPRLTRDQSAMRATVKPVMATAFDRETYGSGTETTAVLVIKDGIIIGERYRKGFDLYTPQRTWSVAKSLAATIVGAAVHQGMIRTDDRVTLDQWPDGDPRRAMTLENLLHMASGLDNGPRGNRTDNIYFGGGRVVDHAVTRRLAVTPGTRWFYANNDTMLAMRYLREAMGDDAAYHQFAMQAVLAPLGMRHTFPETDWNGDFILSSQVYTTARDLGRLGLLYLQDGVWNGKRVLPEGWSDYVTTPAPAQPPLRADGSKRFGYGAQWWLLGGFEGLPADTYAALGNRGQSLTIIPSKDLIIIRRGFDDNGGARFDVARFASDIAKALQ
ncbi:MAG: serine hydrolase [Pseudomonadota bacterium]